MLLITGRIKVLILKSRSLNLRLSPSRKLNVKPSANPNAVLTKGDPAIAHPAKTKSVPDREKVNIIIKGGNSE